VHALLVLGPRERVRPRGATALGTKAEVKNLNSFRFLQKALEHEIARQIEVLAEGGRVIQETRLWDAAAGVTVSMRSKEEAHDYRYFPEPDLPDVVYLEQLTSALYLDKRDDVEKYTEVMERLSVEAESPERSVLILSGMLEEVIGT